MPLIWPEYVAFALVTLAFTLAILEIFQRRRSRRSSLYSDVIPPEQQLSCKSDFALDCLRKAVDENSYHDNLKVGRWKGTVAHTIKVFLDEPTDWVLCMVISVKDDPITLVLDDDSRIEGNLCDFDQILDRACRHTNVKNL